VPWGQLKDILDDNREVIRAEKRDPPVSCPIDGELLDVHADGRRNCPLGNYGWATGLVTTPSQS